MFQLTTPKPISISAPDGSADLPTYELPLATITTANARIRPFHPQHGFQGPSTHRITCNVTSTTINAWPFFHCAVKTELARSFTADEIVLPAMAMAQQHRELFSWNGPSSNLRLTPGGASRYKDASQTFRSGRFGEAAMSIFMHTRGYIYWDHLPSLWKRALQKSSIEHEERTKVAQFAASQLPRTADNERVQEPDYVFEDNSRQVALAESKGSCVSPGVQPDIKGDLNGAIGQLEIWKKLISPIPRKSFAVGTYLREAGDTHQEPSLIAFTDPDDQDPPSDRAVRFPEDWVRRGALGSWLLGMGFFRAGNAVRNGISVPVVRHQLPVIDLNGRKFAFVCRGLTFPSAPGVDWIVSMQQSHNNRINHMFLNPLDHALRRVLFDPFESTDADLATPLVFGMDVGVLRALERAVSSREEDVTLTAEPIVPPELPTAYFSGSVMPDGTLVGALRDLGAKAFPTEQFLF